MTSHVHLYNKHLHAWMEESTEEWSQEQTRDSDIVPFGLQDMAAAVHGFMLNTGAKIPTVGLGTWQAEPGVVGQAVIAAVKVTTAA